MFCATPQGRSHRSEIERGFDQQTDARDLVSRLGAESVLSTMSKWPTRRVTQSMKHPLVSAMGLKTKRNAMTPDSRYTSYRSPTRATGSARSYRNGKDCHHDPRGVNCTECLATSGALESTFAESQDKPQGLLSPASERVRCMWAALPVLCA
eukprot:3722152-Amphidinium_carterae.1